MTIDSSDQVTINLEKHDAKSFKIVVQAPFYDDPPPNTPGDVGEPKWGLWDFECMYSLHIAIPEKIKNFFFYLMDVSSGKSFFLE